MRDAVRDVNNLRDYIINKYGTIDVTILEGRSMGGAIVTHLAERHPDLYNGAVAIGAALLTKDKENPLNYTYQPKIPIIFLTNERYKDEGYFNIWTVKLDLFKII